MAVVYVTEQGASIRKTSKRILIVKDKVPLQDLRLHEIERIVLFGNVQLTTQAIDFMLSQGIDVSFLSMNGKFRGRLTPLESKNVPLRLAQYQRYYQDDFRLSVARRIVQNKIKNGRSLILRYKHWHSDLELNSEINHLEAMSQNVQNQTNIQSLMGVEGESAATYFRAYGKMFLKELEFSTRTRRPPRDPINALLSLGYVILTNEATSLLAANGFDIYIGFFHQIEYGRPSLALDIIEEFRQPVVDRFVLALANKLIFTKEDFDDRGEEGVYLKNDSLKRFLALYDRMMTTPFKDRETGQEEDFRSLLRRQAQRMMKCILSKEEYIPFLFD